MKCRNRGVFQMMELFSMRGSVFPRSCVIAVPSAMLALVLKALQLANIISFESDNVLTNNAAYSGFTFVIGFLLVFRTSQGYGRYWDGSTLLNQMRSRWVEAIGSLIVYSSKSKKSKT